MADTLRTHVDPRACELGKSGCRTTRARAADSALQRPPTPNRESLRSGTSNSDDSSDDDDSDAAALARDDPDTPLANHSRSRRTHQYRPMYEECATSNALPYHGMSTLKVLQYNVQGSYETTVALFEDAKISSYDVIAIQEPWINTRSEALTTYLGRSA